MATNPHQLAIDCLRLMLAPIMRYCLKRAISVQDILESVKVTLIKEAIIDLEEKEEKINVSRISVATGLRRKEVYRIYRDGETRELATSIVTRVIGQWQHDKNFQTKAGKPRILSAQGDDCEFNALVRAISSDVHPGTVLFELQRLNAVELTARGVKLTAFAHVPKGQPKEIFSLLSRDMKNLLTAVEENAAELDEVPNLHLTTHYDNIASEDLTKIRNWLLDEGSAFHAKARKFLSQYDLDINPRKRRNGGCKVVLTSFSKLFSAKNS